MKKIKMIALLLPILAMVACVPARKYEELKIKQKASAEQLDSLMTVSRDCLGKQKDLNNELNMFQEANDRLVKDSTWNGKRYREMVAQYDKMNSLKDEVEKNYEKLRKQIEEESRNLNTELSATQLSLQKKEDELNKIARNLKALEDDLKGKEVLLKEREKRVVELEEVIASKDAAVKALKDKVAAALLGFKDKGLTIEQKNGKVYVSLEAKLLFKSGSTKVDANGKQALVDLAKALEGQGDIEIVVEGHTDSDKLRSTAHPRDNWELSVLRATSVVKIMTESSTIDPKILSAAGRSQYLPVDEADKSKNRRIEIILTPNLDELFEILENKD